MQGTIKLLIYLMLVSGAIFLVYPEQHYNDAGWGVLIKYAIYLPLIGLIAIGLVLLDKSVALATVMLTSMWLVVIGAAWMAGHDQMRLALYTMPVFAAFAPRWVHEAAPRIAYITLWTAALGAIYEYAVLGGFPRFQPTGYRAVSIFVNPNNLGITAVVLYYFTAPLRQRQRIFAFSIAVTLILISGSKTGLLCFVLLWAARNIRATLKGVLLVWFLTGAAVTGAFIFGLIPLDSFYLRLEQYSVLFDGLDGLFYPIPQDELYADNAYLQVWLEVGLLGAIAYLAAIAYCAKRDGLRRPLWLVFAAASMTTNILYLFPLAYLFWFYAGRTGLPQQKVSSRIHPIPWREAFR